MTESARRRFRFGALYAAAWSPLVILSAIANAIMKPHDAPHALTRSVSVVAVAALAGLPVWFFVTRIAQAGVSRWRAIAAHGLMAVGYSVVMSLGVQVFDSRGRGPFVLDVNHLVSPLFVFCFLVIIVHAVASHTRAEQRNRQATAAEQARAEADTLRARAELRALRAHLDPHFLFNTLNAIAAVVETDPPLARQMLVRAAGLLRRLLDLAASGRDMLSLDEEWTIVSEYLAFERLRMGSRLHVDVAITDDALDAEVPAFLLQPIIENSIRHGLFPMTNGGTLRVRGSVERGVLRLEISDTGLGASQQAVETAAGFGLRIARQRLAGAYGQSARVDVDTAPGKGFHVTLTLPAVAPTEAVALRPMVMQTPSISFLTEFSRPT